MLVVEFAEYSGSSGMVRSDNEDCLRHVVPETPAQVQSQGWIFVLADGVGGHDDGEQASGLAVETVLEGFRKIPKGRNAMFRCMPEPGAGSERGRVRQGTCAGGEGSCEPRSIDGDDDRGVCAAV